MAILESAWPKFAVPIIEQMYDREESFGNSVIDQQIVQHNQLARKICQYLEQPQDGTDNYENYLDGLTTLLRGHFTKRILLYLPFSTLQNTPSDFRNLYREVFCDLLNEIDVRENFHEGDVFEPDARKNDQVDLVVKAAHLLPWVIQAGFLNFSELEWLLLRTQDYELLLQNFRETWPILQDWQLFPEAELNRLQELTTHVPPRTRLTPLYNSLKRQGWLSQRHWKTYKLLTPQANLAGPFSANLETIWPAVKMASSQKQLGKNEVALLNGSRLRGYGVIGSDLDYYKLSELASDDHNQPGSANHAYLILTSVWLGGEQVENLSDIAKQEASQYFIKQSQQDELLRRLEIGLVQYRLLHKGYQRFYQISSFDTTQYTTIDGDCAFYDDNYRKIATQIFAKYLFLPSTPS